MPERKITRRLGISLQDVRDALDAFAGTVISAHTRLHVLALDLEALDEVIETNRPLAKTGDAQANMVLLKALDARRILLGISLPARSDPVIVDAQQPPAKTSTQRLRAVVERLCLEQSPKTPETEN